MKKISLIYVIAVSATLLLYGCGSTLCAKNTVSKAEKQLNAALFVDSGSGGIGMFDWASLLEFSPEVKLHLVLGKDVREGILDKMDFMVMPGGYPGNQHKALGAEGVAAVHKFIANGGGYIGTCAGLANTLNNNNRLRLLPFRRRPNSGGHWASLTVDINEKGAKILNVKPGRVLVRYAGGPIPMPGRKVHAVSTGEILATYLNSVSYIGKPEGNFFGQGAVIYGNYGKGKVIATGFHPECWRATHNIALGCIYAVTGKKVTSTLPVKIKRPLRVGYYCAGKDTVDNIEAALRLRRDPRIDITFFANHTIGEAVLDHLDMIVLPDASEKIYKSLAGSEFLQQEINTFIRNGGKVIAAGRAVNGLTDTSGILLIKKNGDLTPELLLKNL